MNLSLRKKQLLLAALILGAASPNAQIEKITVDGNNLDFAAPDLDKYVDLAAGKARWPENVALDARTYNLSGRAAKSGLLIQKGKKYIK